MTTPYELALARTKEAHPDYNERIHRGSIIEIMHSIGYGKDRIAHVITALAGYNDEANFTPDDAELFMGSLQDREVRLARQLKELKVL